MSKETCNIDFSRRSFIMSAAAGIGITGLHFTSGAAEKVIQGFEQTNTTVQQDAVWQPVSDRKIRMGIVGYGVCKFGTAFGLQHHPNVEVVAVSDLMPIGAPNWLKFVTVRKRILP